MPLQIDLQEYKKQQKLLKAKLAILKPFAYLADKESFSDIENMISETEHLFKTIEDYNKLSSKEQLTDKDISKLSEITKRI